MRKLLLVAVLVTSAAWGAGCSTESDVRSDSGPSTTGAGVDASGANVAEPDSNTETTAPSAVPVGPKDSPFLFVQGAVSVPPGDPGKLTVVFTGVPEGDMGSTVPVIIRNNTAVAVGSIEVNGTARLADGALAGSGSSQGFEPTVLEPGEWGFGYIYFDSQLPADASIEATARGDEHTEGAPFSKVRLKVNELNLQPGDYGTSYIGIVSNSDSKETATDPVNVFVGCFDAESKLTKVFTGYADGEVVPGGTASFSVSVYDSPPCASVAVGASGHTF